MPSFVRKESRVATGLTPGLPEALEYPPEQAWGRFWGVPGEPRWPPPGVVQAERRMPMTTTALLELASRLEEVADYAGFVAGAAVDGRLREAAGVLQALAAGEEALALQPSLGLDREPAWV